MPPGDEHRAAIKAKATNHGRRVHQRRERLQHGTGEIGTQESRYAQRPAELVGRDPQIARGRIDVCPLRIHVEWQFPDGDIHIDNRIGKAGKKDVVLENVRRGRINRIARYRDERANAEVTRHKAQPAHRLRLPRRIEKRVHHDRRIPDLIDHIELQQ